MSADLHIHVHDGTITEENRRLFHQGDMGSKYCTSNQDHGEKWDAAFRAYGATPNVWVGSVSWLKAALFEDEASYVPPLVNRISDLIPNDDDGGVEITDDLLAAVQAAFITQAENKTVYELAESNVVMDFLRQHKGKKAFVISW